MHLLGSQPSLPALLLPPSPFFPSLVSWRSDLICLQGRTVDIPPWLEEASMSTEASGIEAMFLDLALRNKTLILLPGGTVRNISEAESAATYLLQCFHLKVTSIKKVFLLAEKPINTWI